MVWYRTASMIIHNLLTSYDPMVKDKKNKISVPNSMNETDRPSSSVIREHDATTANPL